MNLLVAVLTLIGVFSFVKSDCEIFVENNSPIFIKHFGSRQFLLKKRLNSISFGEGETLTAYCSAGIRLLNNNTYIGEGEETKRSFEFVCRGKNFFGYKTTSDQHYVESSINRLSVGCTQELSQFLYESKTPLSNCPNNTYAIGLAIEKFTDIVTAGICYDWTKLDLSFVSYIAYRPKYEFVPNQLHRGRYELPAISLEKRLTVQQSYFNFLSPESFTAQLTVKKVNNELLALDDFDYESIVQDGSLRRELKDFEQLFNIVWWHNLRVGNWKFFLDALEEEAKNTKFIVNLGTHGVLQMPTTIDNKSEVFNFVVDDLRVHTPKYIWSHLTELEANSSKKESIVVVAYNSPFFVSNNSSHILCDDVCDQIDWLRNSLFGRVHLMPSLGVVFCCTEESVASIFTNSPFYTETHFNKPTIVQPPVSKPKNASTKP